MTAKRSNHVFSILFLILALFYFRSGFNNNSGIDVDNRFFQGSIFLLEVDYALGVISMLFSFAYYQIRNNLFSKTLSIIHFLGTILFVKLAYHLLRVDSTMRYYYRGGSKEEILEHLREERNILFILFIIFFFVGQTSFIINLLRSRKTNHN